MKKLVTFAFALLLALSLAACGYNGNTQGDGMGPPVSGAERPAWIPNASSPPAVTEDSGETEDVQKISVEIAASSAYVVNADSALILYQKNSDEPIAPASTSKMLTALTVLDYCSLNDRFTVGAEIGLIASDSSVAWLNHGDTLTVKQLLDALLLPSGNDAAYTLAVNAGKRIAGDDSLSAEQAVKAFVHVMNEKAKEIGAGSSNFVTPDGYDAEGQYTTAFDLAQIAKACLRNDVLTEIMGSYTIDEKSANGSGFTYTNTNNLINPNSSYYYSNAVGLKTGNSAAAGSCLVSAASVNGQTYICVVMGDSADGRFSDSLTIYSAIDPTLSVTPQNTVPAAAPGEMRMRS